MGATGGVGFGWGVFVEAGGCARANLRIRSRKTNSTAPAAHTRTANATMAGTVERGDEVCRGPSREAASPEAGRGLATWEADRINFVSCDVGAWGTTIFW